MSNIAKIERVRNTQGIQTQNQILDIAGRLFGEFGFAGTSMRDISRDSGAALGSLVYHFGTKENLYLQTIRRYIVETGQLNGHFDALLQADIRDKQALANALLQSISSLLRVCVGPEKVEHLSGLYVRIIVDNNESAKAMLLNCFADLNVQLPDWTSKVRPDWSREQVLFWKQQLWSLLQYVVVSEKLIIHDMDLEGEELSTEFLDKTARHIATFACLPLGLPAPA